MGASDSESDKYEELFVNPTILKLVTQRGNVDCGGCNGVVIYYGNFYQYVRPLKEGHISVALERKTNPFVLTEKIDRIIND